MRGGCLPEIAPRQTGAAVTRPTGARISGRSSARQAGGLRTTVRSNRSEPMTSGNTPAAGCSHNRARRAATLMVACGRADERTPAAVNRIIVPQVKGGPSGQGRGRTADLPLSAIGTPAGHGCRQRAACPSRAPLVLHHDGLGQPGRITVSRERRQRRGNLRIPAVSA
jgi:hypothetical protein